MTTQSPTATARDIALELMKRNGPQTLNEVAESLGLSRTATRAHLLKLEGNGLIARVAAQDERRGRPPLTYRLTTAGDRLFPTDDGDVLSALLDFLKDQGREPLITAFFEDLWERRMREFEDELTLHDAAGHDFNARLLALTRVLDRGHFMPLLETDGACVRVSECHCPLPAAVRSTRIPCRLEAEFIARALQSELVDATFADGVTRMQCVFELRQGQPSASST